MYLEHPCSLLKQAFSAKPLPFQGAEPESAEFLFVGLDANYDENIEKSPIFPCLLEYLRDGLAFWEKYDVHHPFLLPQYRGNGRFYHETFRTIGFRSRHRGDVSFIELLHVPTYENKSEKKHKKKQLEPGDLNSEHLRKVNNAILRGSSRFIFIAPSVAKLMRTSGEFSWLLSGAPRPVAGSHLKVWNVTNDFPRSKKVYWHYHFSVYGKFNEEKMKQIDSIRRLLEATELT